MPDFSHIDGAQENERVVEDLDETKGSHRNWMVTVHFYSLVHYVDERLESEGYNQKNHRERRSNIRQCTNVDSKIYNKYRTLETLSRNSRYECERMNREDVETSNDVLEEAKDILGFTHGGRDGEHKYSTS